MPRTTTERDKAMLAAREKILGQVGDWLCAKGFERGGAGHFIQHRGETTCHVSHASDTSVVTTGPWSDAYERPNSPNGKKYSFGWSTREPDIQKCIAEYCLFIEDVVFAWFNEPTKGH